MSGPMEPARASRGNGWECLVRESFLGDFPAGRFATYADFLSARGDVLKAEPRSHVTLLICDDHRVLTDALATVVGLDDTLELVAAPVHDAESAVALCLELLPDVVLMDIEFKGGMSGIEATRRIKEASPSTNMLPGLR